MIAKVYNSSNSNIVDACNEILQKTKDDKLYDYDFVIIAISSNYDIDKVFNLMNEKLDKDKCLIFHAIDAFCNDIITQDGITALFIKFEKSGKINVFYKDNLSTNSEEVFQETVSYLKSKKDSFHIIITGECHNNIATFIEELGKSDININNIQGGVSSGIIKNNEYLTYQFYDNKVIKDGFVIISFDNVIAHTSISMGFEPVGVNYTITKSDFHRLYTLDNSSISDIVKRLSRGIKRFKFEHLHYTPLVILDESNENLLTLRTFREMGEDWVEFWGPVKNGQKVRLTYGEYDSLLEADKISADNLYTKLPNPELILNFSCIAREYVLENNFLEENKIYIDKFNAPLFGFFTFGEIGHAPNRTSLQFYNETSLLTVMREK